jgi:hypothetical protein
MNKWDEARNRPADPRPDEEYRQELADLIQDAQLSAEDAHSVRIQLVNA